MTATKRSLQPLRGIVPPMVTPLNLDGSLDIDSVKILIDHLIEGGVHGIFILGTTGEFSQLSYHTRRELIQETCKLVQGRVPVLVGITDVSIEESVSLAKVAAESGADAVVAAPPFYMNIDQDELHDYFWQLAGSVSLPLYLYNMPSHTKLVLEVSTVMRLSAHPNVIGLKDSSANGVYFQSLCHAFRENKDFVLMVGPEEMMAETVLMGSHGGVCGGANLFPSLYVKLYEAAANRDFDRIQKYQAQVMNLGQQIYQLGGYKSSYLKGLKTALSLKGLCQANFLPPLFPFKEEEVELLKKKVEALVLSQEQIEV